MRKIINKKFFKRDSLVVAKELIGKFIVREIENKKIAYMITETEAYAGIKDLASHSSKGMTKRTEVLFGEAGYLYVYLCYGIHWMLNIVTSEEGGGVLIRGIEGFSGPGKVTKILNISGGFNGVKLGRKNGIWVEDRGVYVDEKKIKITKRIGVDYAGPVWSKKLYRFILDEK